MAGWHKSIYRPVNTEKFKGKSLPIARSSWELSVMQYFDHNPEVLEWASEPIAIPYLKPTTGRIHRYYPDFLMIYRTPTGEIRKEMIEIKPASQSRRSRSRNAQTRLNETIVYQVNVAKWNAAQEWCKQNGFTFRVITEKGDMTKDKF